MHDTWDLLGFNGSGCHRFHGSRKTALIKICMTSTLEGFSVDGVKWINHGIICILWSSRDTGSIKLWGKSSHSSRLHGQEKRQKIAAFMNQTRLCSTKLTFQMAYGNLINCGSMLSLQ